MLETLGGSEKNGTGIQGWFNPRLHLSFSRGLLLMSVLRLQCNHFLISRAVLYLGRSLGRNLSFSERVVEWQLPLHGPGLGLWGWSAGLQVAHQWPPSQ